MASPLGIELLSPIITAFAVLISDKPEGIDLGASFAFSNIFVGGLGSTAASRSRSRSRPAIGFEATAIYGEESKEPHKTVPRATYLAVIDHRHLRLHRLAIVTGLGSSAVVDKTVELSTVDKVPLANPANVLFSIADTYVGGWMKS